MRISIIRECETTNIPTRLLLDISLSLKARGAAAVMLAGDTQIYSNTEMSELLGISETELVELIAELVNADYGEHQKDVFVLYDNKRPCL